MNLSKLNKILILLILLVILVIIYTYNKNILLTEGFTNDNNHKGIIINMNDVGFFSQIKFTLNKFIYCKKYNINFNIESDKWIYKYNYGWLDYFENIDLMCIDLQGYELNALKSLGSKLNNVKYIITECSISTTYINGVEFKELSDYLALYNFKYIRSNKYGSKYPDVTKKYYAEFDSLFINESLLL